MTHQDFVVLNLVFRAALLRVKVSSGDLEWSVGHQENGELELRYVLA